MAKRKSSSLALQAKLDQYFATRNEIEFLEKELETIKKTLFEDVSVLPEKYTHEGIQYTLQAREETIKIKATMIEEAGYDPTKIVPIVSFTKKDIESVFGKVAVEDVENTTSFKKSKTGQKTYFYKK